MEFIYYISQFNWDVNSREFTAYMETLAYPYYSLVFPNRGRQFFIYNERTNNFRRFRLVKEDDISYRFISEDDIGCIVIKAKGA